MPLPRLSQPVWSVALLAGLLPAASAPTVSAQDVLDLKSATEIRHRYLTDLDTVHVKIMALAEAIPDSSYGWRPAPGTRSVSEALMHVASEWFLFAPMAAGGKAPADFGPPRETLPKLEKITGKQAVLDQLRQSWIHCRQQIEAADPAKLTGKMKFFGQDVTLTESAFIMAGDLHEHLGQLVTYARSVGVTPPWSRKP